MEMIEALEGINEGVRDFFYVNANGIHLKSFGEYSGVEKCGSKLLLKRPKKVSNLDTRGLPVEECSTTLKEALIQFHILTGYRVEDEVNV